MCDVCVMYVLCMRCVYSLSYLHVFEVFMFLLFFLCMCVCMYVYLFVCACAYVCVRELTNVPSSLVEQMKEVMHATEGVGIAAPQVGISKSLFVCEGK